jgi:hypothetical protein
VLGHSKLISKVLRGFFNTQYLSLWKASMGGEPRFVPVNVESFIEKKI